MSHRTFRLPGTLNKLSIYALSSLKTFIQDSDIRCTLFFGRFLLQSKHFEHEVNGTPSNYLNHIGLTLVELIMAISIVGILATIAVPNVLSEIPKFRLDGAALKVMVDLMSARMKAVSHSRKVKIFFTGNNQYKICEDADNNGSVDDCEGNSKVINIQDNYKGVILSSNNNPIFNPRGTASNLATINITNLAGTKCISIAITGRVRINSCPD